MAVLTREAILAEIDAGRLVVDPFDRAQVGPASIDLALGEEIRLMEPGPDPVPVTESTDHRAFTRLASLREPYRLLPGATIHGMTRESLHLPPDLCGFLEGRSRFARLGLMIHVTSAFVQPGMRGRQVLEISNVAGRTLELHAGVRVCQVVLLRTEGEAVYRGRFEGQDRP